MSFLRRLTFNLRYFRRPPWDSGITPPELLAFLARQPAGRAIDLGCGTGTNVISLARLGWQVAGVDFVPKAIDQARQKAKAAGVNADLRVGDVTRLDGISGTFDLVLDLGCFHGLSPKEKGDYLRQMERILAPGGIWFLYAFLRPPSDETPPGLSSVEIEQLSARYVLTSRADGLDRKSRPSAYFIFQKPQTES